MADTSTQSIVIAAPPDQVAAVICDFARYPEWVNAAKSVDVVEEYEDGYASQDGAPGSAVTCNDSNVCTVDSCDAAVGCVYTPGNAGTVCRAANGVCDAAETCSGSSNACPTDAYLPSTTMCRNRSGNICDVADFCTGTSIVCPNSYAPQGTDCAYATGAVVGSCCTPPR